MRTSPRELVFGFCYCIGCSLIVGVLEDAVLVSIAYIDALYILLVVALLRNSHLRWRDRFSSANARVRNDISMKAMLHGYAIRRFCHVQILIWCDYVKNIVDVNMTRAPLPSGARDIDAKTSLFLFWLVTPRGTELDGGSGED